MPDTRTPGELVHRVRCAENARRERPFVLAAWEHRTPEQKAMDEAMAAAVEADVRERIADGLRRLAHDAAAMPSTVPGIERDTRRDTYLAAAQVVQHGVTQGQERSDEEEADRGQH